MKDYNIVPMLLELCGIKGMMWFNNSGLLTGSAGTHIIRTTPRSSVAIHPQGNSWLSQASLYFTWVCMIDWCIAPAKNCICSSPAKILKIKY